MMDTKQKSLLVLTVAALGFLGYQIFQLVDRDITESPAIIESTTAPSSMTMPVNPVVRKQPQPVVMQKQPTTQASSDALNQGQHAYVQMLNQFELVKLHRQLLDEETAVATAQNQIAQLHSQTAKITGVSSDDSSVVGASAVALSYIDQQDGQWSATLHIGNDYQSVTRGSVLSNGYQVVDINRQGITLQKNQARELLTFDGMTALPNVPVIAKPIVAKLVVKKPVVVVKPVATQIAKPVITASVPVVHPAVTVAKVSVPMATPTSAVAKKAALLTIKPKQTIIAKPLATVVVPSHAQVLAAVKEPKVIITPKKPIAPPIELSIHDHYAEENGDDLQNNELSQELHLPSVEIQPVIDQQAYSVNSYLPQNVVVPQTYHLDDEASSSANENQYALESSDDVSAPAVVSHHKKMMRTMRLPTVSEKQFLAQPSKYYTIQLIGSPYLAVVHRYVLANKLGHSAIQLRLNNGKGLWTIAVLGTYPNEIAARAACSKLPKHLRSNGAWVRKIGDIQKSIS